MEDKLRWKFNVFLLQIARELTEGDLQQMKFVLRGYVTSAKCDDMKALQYVEELQKLLLLTPTKLEIFKETLTVIGRPDLVEKIEEKEATFAALPGENLEQKEYDAVCDGIEKAAAAGKFKSLPRADLSASKYRPKKISLSKSQLYFDGSLQEGSKLAPDHKLAGLATGGETGEVDMANGGDLPDALSPGAGLSSLKDLEINKPASSESCESTVMDGTCSEKLLRPNMTGFGTGVASSTTSTSREPGDDDDDDDDCVTDGDPNKEGKSKETTGGHEGLNTSTAATGYGTFPTMPSSAKEPTEAIYTSSSSPKGVIVPDDEGLTGESPMKKPGESEPAEASSAKEPTEAIYTSSSSPKGAIVPDNEGLAGETPMEKPGESEPAEASSAKEPSEDFYASSDSPKGTIFSDDDSPAGDAPMEDPEESETLLKSTHHEAGHDPYGGARPKEKMGCPGVSLANTKQNEKESSKVPIEDECTSPTVPHPSDPMKDTEGTEPSQKKAKSFQFVPGPGASSKSQHGPGVFQGDSSGGAYGYTHPSGLDAPYQGMPPGPYFPMPSGPPPMSSGSAGPTPGGPYGSNPPPFGSHFPSGGTMPSGPPPMSSGSAGPTPIAAYQKAGYTVAISNGSLCYSGEDKGMVMMISGTSFVILIANGNSHAAEVDITFGGIYLGVWIAEANSELLSNPLIIEGSSWAPGRLTYFSKGDAKRQKVNSEFFGQEPELNGQIVLEFKPEVLMLKLVVKHLWKAGTQKEISMPDFKTATIGELKERIKQKYNPDVSCLVMGGKILNEDKTMSSHAMENANEVIEVLYTKEELMIEPKGRDPITMTVDPFNLSVSDVKDFIEQELNIPVSEQYLRFNGQNVEEINLLNELFLKSKESPKIKLDKDREIEINVSSSPHEGPKKITMKWFATVDELKKKLIEQRVCETIITLQVDGVDISREDKTKKLIDLNFKPKSALTVHSTTTPKRGTLRGFSANDVGSRTRGFGFGHTRGLGSEQSSSFKSRYRGNGDLPGSSTLRAGADGIQHDSAAAHTREGVAMLHGNQESVFKNFQVDKEEWKFSKEKAVILTIQLIDQSSGGVSGPSPCYMPTGTHDPGDPRNPMSTLVPPPVPE